VRILVTGATGFTGGHLARALVARGGAVRAFVREGSDPRRLANLGCEIVTGDIREVKAVDRAVVGVEQVHHLAAAFRVAGKPDSYYREIHVDGTKNVLSAARRHGVARILHCSTVGVHGDVGPVPIDETAPFNPGDIYQHTKLEAERLAAEAFSRDLRGVIFRPGAIYGPGDLRFLKLFRAIRNGRFFMLGSGNVHYHLVYVDDLVNGILLCAEREAALGRTYILAGERSVTLNELVGSIARAVGVAAPGRRLPLWPVRMLAAACEAVCTPLNISPPIYPRRVDFFRKERSFRIDRARKELGYSPAVGLEEGLRRTAEWYVSEGLLKPPERR